MSYAGPLNLRPSTVPLDHPSIHGEEITSTLLTATATVFTGPCRLRGLDLVGGSVAADATIYDNTSAAGDEVAVSAAAIQDARHMHCNIACKTGIHIVLAGTGVNAIVRYST